MHLSRVPQPLPDWARAAEGMSIFFSRMSWSSSQNPRPFLPNSTVNFLGLTVKSWGYIRKDCNCCIFISSLAGNLFLLLQYFFNQEYNSISNLWILILTFYLHNFFGANVPSKHWKEMDTMKNQNILLSWVKKHLTLNIPPSRVNKMSVAKSILPSGGTKCLLQKNILPSRVTKRLWQKYSTF